MNHSQIYAFVQCLSQVDNAKFWDSPTNGSSNSSKLQLDDHEHEHDHDHDHEHDHDADNTDNSDLLIAKVVAMLALFFLSALCGSIPFLLNRHFKWTQQNTNARSATVVQLLLYFGGGVLLCTTFQHLLPEVQETIEQLQKCEILPKLTFSLAELLMCAGFFLMYLIEEVIHVYIHRHRRLLEQNAGAGAAFQRGQSVRNSCLVKRNSNNNGNANLEETSCSTSATATGEPSELKPNLHAVTLCVQDLLDQNDVKNQKYDASTQQQQSATSEKCFHKHEQEKHDHHHHHLPITHKKNVDDDDDMITASLRGFFIVLALSLHELFEGMAIGLEHSAASVWFMCGAVSAHKLVLAFCVGVELIVTRTRLALSIVYIFTFAVVSPIGIGIGILVSQHDHGSTPSIPSAILQGFACGTLLYVVFFEILNKNRSGLMAYFALLVGFAVMFGLQQLGIGNDGHGHSHGQCAESEHNDHNHIEENAATIDTQINNKNHMLLKEQLQMLRQTSRKLIQEISQNNELSIQK